MQVTQQIQIQIQIQIEVVDIIITTEGVAKLLHGLNPNKATGPDDIPARIFQLAANELAPALQIIFQKSLDTGKLPLSWSQANIAPIFKKGDRSLAENYRPISLTSICLQNPRAHNIH